MQESTPCNYDELDAVVERLADVARIAIEYGIKPVVAYYPDWWDLNLAEFQ